MEQAEKTTARLRARMDELANAQNKSAGPSALRQIIDYAAGWFSVAGAIGAVTAALRAQRQISQEAAAGLTAGFEGRAALQLIATSPQDNARLQSFAESLVSRGVTKRGPEGDITAGLVKAGLTPSDMKAVAKLAEDDKLKASEMVAFAEGAKGFQRVFGISSFDQAAAMLIEGARTSRATPGELGQMALRFGEGTRKLPAGESLASALAILETSATQRSAASRLEQIVGGGGRLSAAESASRAAHLRRLQGVTGLAGLPDFVSGDPNLSAENIRQESEGRLATARQARARRELLFQSVRAQEQQVAENQNFIMRSMDWIGGGLGGYFPDWYLQNTNRQQPGYLSQDLLDQIKIELENQTRIMGGDARPPRPSGRQEN